MAGNEQIETIFRKRRWHHRRDIRFMLVIGVCFAIYVGYGHITGPSRISDRLQAALDPQVALGTSIERF